MKPQATQTVVEAQRETHAVSTVGESFLPGNTGNEKWMVADRSVLSRVLLSVDKALASAPLLEINLRDEADIHFLAQASTLCIHYVSFWRMYEGQASTRNVMQSFDSSRNYFRVLKPFLYKYTPQQKPMKRKDIFRR